jgi:hypothetical protein
VKKKTLRERWQSISAFTTVTLWTILLGQISQSASLDVVTYIYIMHNPYNVAVCTFEI